MKSTVLRMLALPRRMKQQILMVADFVALPILLWMVLALRYDTLTPPILPTLPLGGLYVAIFSTKSNLYFPHIGNCIWGFLFLDIFSFECWRNIWIFFISY